VHTLHGTYTGVDWLVRWRFVEALLQSRWCPATDGILLRSFSGHWWSFWWDAGRKYDINSSFHCSRSVFVRHVL